MKGITSLSLSLVSSLYIHNWYSLKRSCSMSSTMLFIFVLPVPYPTLIIFARPIPCHASHFFPLTATPSSQLHAPQTFALSWYNSYLCNTVLLEKKIISYTSIYLSFTITHINKTRKRRTQKQPWIFYVIPFIIIFDATLYYSFSNKAALGNNDQC